MIIPRDYDSEMGFPDTIDDATAEAVLAGHDVADELEPLRRLVVAYRDAARWPVPPRGELAVRMATGAFAPPPRRRAGSVDHPVRPHRAARPRRRTRAASTTGLAAAAAKLAGLSGAAKAAAGIAVAAASLATAGIATAAATGSLPEPVQDGFDRVVDVVTGDPPAAPTGHGEEADSAGLNGGEVGGESKQPGDQHRDGGGPTPDQPGRPSDLPAPDQPPTPDTGPAAPAERPSPVPSDPGPAAPSTPPRPAGQDNAPATGPPGR